MQQRSSRELWVAFLIIGILSFFYLAIVILAGSIPAASDFLGHSLGVIGFILMVMTETLYSLRKRRLSARWGRVSSWLDFHIISGIVGPYLVLLHTAWKFNGLAGLVMLLTGVVVLSGFIGRYIYTAVPRRVDGAEMETSEVERLIHGTQSELTRWMDTQPVDIQNISRRILERTESLGQSSHPLHLRFIDNLKVRSVWEQESRSLTPAVRRQLVRLGQLINRRRQLSNQIQSLATARQLLALWHTVHIPIGMALFTAAIVHIGAAIYYATLLR